MLYHFGLVLLAGPYRSEGRPLTLPRSASGSSTLTLINASEWILQLRRVSAVCVHQTTSGHHPRLLAK